MTCKEAIDEVCGERIEEKTAKEMFEKLGYQYRHVDKCILCEKDDISIFFANDTKCVTKHKVFVKSIGITSKEIKAIQKQFEELEW